MTYRERSYDLDGLRAAIAGGADREATTAICGELRERAAAGRAAFGAAVAAEGGAVLHDFWLINASLVELPAGVVDRIRARPDVQAVHRDEVATPSKIWRSTNAQNHRATLVHQQNVLGTGATVAIVDSGLDLSMGTSNRPHRCYFVDGDPSNSSGGGIGGSRVQANFQIGSQSAESFNGHGHGVTAVAAGEVWSSSPLAARGHAPRAHIVGYGIANDLLGNSSLATIALAFEQMVIDRATYGIVCANNSYSGTPDPTHPSQQAMDAAASVGDILVTVAAGNEGSNQRRGPSCANGLAVAAVAADTKELAAFSSWGPLTGDAERDWPDICACGVDVVMPARDSEDPGAVYLASGTSFAAPQVCGAAALYRSLRPSASALETKAAILCATEDVFPQNRWSIPSSRRTLGAGFLRDDLLVGVAQGQGVIHNDTLSAAHPGTTVVMPVVAGNVYAAVLTWHRHELGSADWSDLALEVRDGQGRVLAVSDSPRNLVERCVFAPTETGDVTLVVQSHHLEIATLPVALVAAATPAQTRPGGAMAFGTGCRGTGGGHHVRDVLPPSYRQAFAGVPSNLLVEPNRRLQLIVRGDLVAAPRRLHGIAFRRDNLLSPAPLALWSDIEVRLGRAALSPAAAANTFAQNELGPPRVVFARRQVHWPVAVGVNTDPTDWALQLRFDQPVDWQPAPGDHLLIEILVHAGNWPGPGTRYPIDGFWHQNDPNPEMTLVSGFQVTSTFGGKLVGRGVVVGLLATEFAGEAPALTAGSWPVMSRPYWIDLDMAPASAPAFLTMGFDDQVVAGHPLPFSLQPYGAPGCALLTSSTISDLLVCDAAGRARAQRILPLAPFLLGTRLFHQGLVLDPGANALGLTTSNGLLGVVGDRW